MGVAVDESRHRVRELDEIKAKVAETEALLQKRLDTQQESVELQLKIMLREADGFGFFHNEDARSQQFSVDPGVPGGGSIIRSFRFGSPGPPRVPVGSPAGLQRPNHR